jgi:hypothetical protein
LRNDISPISNIKELMGINEIVIIPEGGKEFRKIA